jgi:hypothetical protein
MLIDMHSTQKIRNLMYFGYNWIFNRKFKVT